MQTFASIAILLNVIVNVQGEYKELELIVLSGSGIDIQNAAVTPMPILNPGEAFLTFNANLKRPISKRTFTFRSVAPLSHIIFDFLLETIRTDLKIERAVSGIRLPIKCYKIGGVEVGSCSYSDLCRVLKAMLPSFKPDTCPPPMAQYGIDCNCPFNIPAGQLDIIKERLELPDAQSTIAGFMSLGDFSIQLDAYDEVGSYASIILKFSVKPVTSSG